MPVTLYINIEKGKPPTVYWAAAAGHPHLRDPRRPRVSLPQLLTFPLRLAQIQCLKLETAAGSGCSIKFRKPLVTSNCYWRGVKRKKKETVALRVVCVRVCDNKKSGTEQVKEQDRVEQGEIRFPSQSLPLREHAGTLFYKQQRIQLCLY